ncbi:chemotaxis protein CheD [Haloarcula nitratireducens]|uniref:Probable chemoreceptor glutamine deamidase CheD n=1 Tax=Haloarcula nitratireducens TaxID=2487749 RepID=A0AAW4PDK1_9EURY|nr:chemotaxis protein CheD [Halomicroarcula nitratireducens]MBX0295505.1 chemotaxis protein CheD [Halomicroarcula nitratireducens]
MRVYDGTQSETTQTNDPERVKIGIAEYQVTTDSAVLTTSGLGSCIGVAIYDELSGAAGLVHVMLPTAEDVDGGNRAKFADTGVAVLVEALEAEGASRDGMRAKIAGGSDMLDFSENGSSIGSRNAEKVRETLEAYGIPLVGEDVGGDHGRSLRLESDTGNLVVKSANTDSATL